MKETFLYIVTCHLPSFAGNLLPETHSNNIIPNFLFDVIIMWATFFYLYHDSLIKASA